VMLAVPVSAHHSIAGIYDGSKQVTVDGTVLHFRFVNPHPYVEVSVTDRRGAATQWRLEMDNRSELAGIGMTADTIKPGDRVTVTGSPSRSDARAMYVRKLLRPADGLTYEQVGSTPRISTTK
jgi:hypothetical protein